MLPQWTAPPGFPLPQRWALKKDMPKELQAEGKRVRFRFEIAWVAVDHSDAILLPNGQRLPTFTFCLRTPGWVIGPRDNQSGAGRPWSFEWQTASAERMLELAGLRVQ